MLSGKATVFAKAPGWERGWGVPVGNKPLALPSGSTPSHEVSLSQMAQNQRGAQMHDSSMSYFFLKRKGEVQLGS